MSKILHLEPTGGIAGDMFVACIINAHPNLEDELLSVMNDFLPNYIQCSFISDTNGGISGQRFIVKIDDKKEAQNQHPIHFTDICNMINKGVNSKSVAKISTNIFHHLASAESQVHSIPIQDVHFHEIADWDSIADIVASALLIDKLSHDSKWSCSPLPLGNGKIKTTHGLLPIPAPATAILLKGMTVYDDQIKGERVTPTGAAILREIKPINSLPIEKLKINNIGYGLGSNVLEGIPNILRFIQYDSHANSAKIDKVIYYIFNIDDQTPEELAVSLDVIRAVEGVLDVIQSIAYGKKGRVLFIIEVMASSNSRDKVLESIFSQTSTIGVREEIIDRKILPRKYHEIEMQGKKVLAKTVNRPKGQLSTKVESDHLVADSLLERRKTQYLAQEIISKRSENNDS